MHSETIFKQTDWTSKISNVCQVGGIETSVLDNGSARGTRIAWINTGTGLRYKVVLDRAMDIADAFYNQYSIAWLSHGGITYPQPFSDKGIEWLRTFGGGLLTTCGLTHVGGPEKDEFGERGLHGHISNTAAEIISVVQPDPLNGKMDMSITGVMKESRVFGPALELTRTISGRLGEAFIHIRDEIVNRANTASPHMLMYHFNFGWPLADENAYILLDGAMQLVNKERDEKIFNNRNDFRRCSAPMDLHKGSGECAAYFDMPADENNNCLTGLLNERLGFGITMQFNKEQLPVLTNWQHWAPNEYVTGIEPCTNPPIGQARARRENSLRFIEPGASRSYEIRLDVINNSTAISNLINKTAV